MLKRVILSSSLVALSLAMSPAPNASAYWGTYQYDAQLSGKGPVKGPSIANIKWTYTAPQQVFTDPNDPNNDWFSVSSFRAGVTEGPDGTIYTAGDDGRAYAFDPRNGTVKYIFEGVGVCCAPPVVGKDGTIYFSGNGLFALNPDFTLKFYYADGGSCCGAITVADDGTILVGNGWMHAIDPANLVFLDPSSPDPLMAKAVAPKWIYNEFGADWAPAVSPDGTTVYTSTTSKLNAIDTTTLILNETENKNYAATKWSVDIINDRGTMPVIINGTIYVADDRSIVAINPVTAAKRVVYSFSGKQVVRLANNSGTLVATVIPVTITVDPDTQVTTRSFDDQNDGAIELYTINPVAGSVLWNAPLTGAGSDTMPIIDNTGAIYIGTVSHADGTEYQAELAMFTTTTTAPFFNRVFTYTKNTVLGSDQRGMMIGMDGTLYTIIDGQLVAFGGTSDLSPTIIADPTPISTNGAYSFTTTVANAGPDKAVAAILKQTLPTGFTAAPNFVLPSNCIMNSSRVLTCTLGDIAPGTNVPMKFTSTAPSTAGTVSTTAAVKNDVPDTNVANNSKTISVSVVAPPPPVACDLVVSVVPKITTSTGTSTTSVTRGTTKYNFIATVKNQGTGTCAASTLGFFFSTNTTIDSSDYKIGTAPVTSLAAGASKAITLNVAVPTSLLSASSYYLGAFADSPAVIAEKVETNNTAATASKITVK
ncbi:MAG: CARDB domain-containing protein [Desulfuromonadaceae bacterium]